MEIISRYKKAAACLSIALMLISGCSTSDDYWSLPIWGSAIRGDQSSPLYLSFAPLVMVEGIGPSSSPEAALAAIALPLFISGGILAVLTATDLALLPVTVPHDIWLYLTRRGRDQARRERAMRFNAFSRVLFEDDPEALERFLGKEGR